MVGASLFKGDLSDICLGLNAGPCTIFFSKLRDSWGQMFRQRPTDDALATAMTSTHIKPWVVPAWRRQPGASPQRPTGCPTRKQPDTMRPKSSPMSTTCGFKSCARPHRPACSATARIVRTSRRSLRKFLLLSLPLLSLPLPEECRSLAECHNPHPNPGANQPTNPLLSDPGRSPGLLLCRVLPQAAQFREHAPQVLAEDIPGEGGDGTRNVTGPTPVCGGPARARFCLRVRPTTEARRPFIACKHDVDAPARIPTRAPPKGAESARDCWCGSLPQKAGAARHANHQLARNAATQFMLHQQTLCSFFLCIAGQPSDRRLRGLGNAVLR